MEMCDLGRLTSWNRCQRKSVYGRELPRKDVVTSDAEVARRRVSFSVEIPAQSGSSRTTFGDISRITLSEESEARRNAWQGWSGSGEMDLLPSGSRAAVRERRRGSLS